MGIRCYRDTTAYVSVADHADLRLADWTVSCCFRVDVRPATDTVHTIVAKGDHDTTTKGNYQLAVRDDSGTLKLRGGFITAGGVAYATSYTWTDMTVDRWYAAALSWDDTNKDLRLYLAALEYRGTAGETTYTQVSTDTHAGVSSNNTSTSALTFGAAVSALATSGIGNGGNLSVSEVALYGAEIAKATLDGRLSTRLAGSETDLTGYWPCDERTGSTVYDRAGSAFNGTLTNRAQWADCPIQLEYSVGLFAASYGVVGYLDATKRRGVVITASEEATGYEDDRLKSPRKALTWRSSDVAGAKTIVFNLGTDPPPVSVLTIDNHNLTAEAVITVNAHSALAWGAPDVTETVTVNVANGVIRHVMAYPYQYRYWRILFSDAGGSGYFEFGAVGLWCCWEAGFPVGSETVSYVDPSTAVVLPHGTRVKRSQTKAPLLSVDWPQLTRGQSQELRRVMTEAGGAGYIFVCPDPARRLYEMGIYGIVQQLPGDSLADPSWSYVQAGQLVVMGDVV